MLNRWTCWRRVVGSSGVSGRSPDGCCSSASIELGMCCTMWSSPELTGANTFVSILPTAGIRGKKADSLTCGLRPAERLSNLNRLSATSCFLRGDTTRPSGGASPISSKARLLSGDIGRLNVGDGVVRRTLLDCNDTCTLTAPPLRDFFFLAFALFFWASCEKVCV